MKKFHKCPNCENEYDAFLSECPTCSTRNNTFPIDRKFYRMIFLSDYKEIVLFVAAFVGVYLFYFLMNLGLMHFPMGEVLKSATNYFVTYALVFGIMLCIIWKDWKIIIRRARSVRSIVAGAIGCLAITAFIVAYIAILTVTKSGFDYNVNQTILGNVIRNYPAMGFFILVIFSTTAEDFGYRLGLFTFLRKRNRWLAYLVCAAIYAIIHFQFLNANLVNEAMNIPLYFVPAIMLSILYEYEGFSASVYASVLAKIIIFVYVFFSK